MGLDHLGRARSHCEVQQRITAFLLQIPEGVDVCDTLCMCDLSTCVFVVAAKRIIQN